MIFACASSEATTSTIQPSEVEGDRAEEARVVIFELEIERRGDPDAVSLTKIGDWSFEGPVEGVVVHKGIDGMLMRFIRAIPIDALYEGQIHLLHVDASQHLIRQKVIVEDKLSRVNSPLPGTSSTTSLPLPNPFKVLKGLKSSENLGDETTNADPARIRLSDAIDMGLLPLNGQLLELRFDDGQRLSSGCAWSQQEILVRLMMSQYAMSHVLIRNPQLFDVSGLSLGSLGAMRLQDVRDFRRHDDDYVTVRFPVRILLRNNHQPFYISPMNRIVRSCTRWM